jgi:Glycoside hydrolase family 5 C-terminal domain/Cellulase (glycosyl hydrolase family 5)
MPLLKKILIGFITALGAILIGAVLYLFADSPFPSYSTSGLTKTESSQLVLGKAVVASGDSLHKNISSKGQWFVDRTGRVMILHGINVGGSSKLPYTPLIASHQKENFYESVYTVSFVGRPFPLKQADDHFKRLQQWGYRFVRLVITWEAIEHAGPGRYDEDYLDYVQAIVKKAATYNINIFIDPHQDVWSRFTGGDGAPYWTLEKVGFDPLKFTETGSAVIHNIKGDLFPRMIWPTNYNKLGAATMFTLFFGGNDFAPSLKIDSVSAQDYLQTHYINAIKQVAMKLKGLPNVIGFDTFNEPDAGYIGMKDLTAHGLIKKGTMPTPFQGMVLGDGNSLEIGRFEFALTGAKEKGKIIVNPNKFSAWKNSSHDSWKEARVWDYDIQQKPVLLKPNYFSVRKGKPVDFSEDYFKPFVKKYKEAIHSVDSNWLIFAEAALLHELPKFTESEADNMVNAGHWYDAATLLTKEYSSWFGVDVVKGKAVFGKRAIRKTFHSNMAKKKEETESALGNKPTLIGEFGIPYDLAEKNAYKTGDFADQEECLDRSFQAMESHLLSYALWNYTADNDNIHGDQWNGEDLSIFSKSQQKNVNEMNSGGRALKAAIRPYPYKVAGEPMEYFFDMDDGEFYLKFKAGQSIAAPTEIFVPKFHFKKGFEVFTSPGRLEFDKGNDLLLFYPEKEGEQILVVRKK